MGKPKFASLIHNVSSPNFPEEKSDMGIQSLLVRESLVGKPEKSIVIKLVPREKLVFNEKNDYSQENIESLAASILMLGLQNFPSGYYDEELDQYVLENGERRTRALDLLLEKYRNFPEDSVDIDYKQYKKNIQRFERGYPVYVNSALKAGEKFTELEEIDHRLTLIDCNVEERDDPEDRLRHIQEKKKLLERRKILTHSNENINQAIAQSEGISERQVQKYNAVATLVPELQELFKKKEITLNDGEFCAKLSEDDQRRIVELIIAGERGSARELQQLNEQLQETERQKQKVQEEYEKKLQQLKEEKDSQEEAVAAIVEATKRQAEDEKSRIRAEIEEQYRKDMPHPEQISALQTRLAESDDKFKKTLGILENEKKKASKKDEEIRELKVELQALQAAQEPRQDIERIKVELTYRQCCESLLRSINQLAQSVPNHIEHTVITKDINELIYKLQEILK